MSTPHASSRSRLPKWATSFGNQIIASLILGIVLGALALALGGDAKSNPNWLMVTLDTIGSSYVTLLKAAVVPLIFTAVVASISNLSQVTNAARLAVNTLIWFAITAFFAVLIGIAMGLIVQPGVGAQVQGKAYTGSTGSWTAFLTGLIPVNFLGLGVSAKSGDSGITASASFNVLQILVISGAVGIAALKVGEAAKPFIDVVKSALAIIQKILWWIIRLAPLGTVGLIAKAVFAYGWASMGSLVAFVIALYIGLLLVFLVVYPIIVRANGLSVRQYFSGVWPALQLGFVSRSSMGSMPMTQTVAERNLGVPRAYASFAVPLGATDHQDGRLRLGLPGSGGDFRGSVLRYSAGLHPVPADCDGVRARFGCDCRYDRRYRDADSDPVHSGSAPGRRGSAPGDRPDRGHGSYRSERCRSGSGSRDCGSPRGHLG